MANEDCHTRQLALIRAARTLEQDTTRPIDEKIRDIWLLLSAAKGGHSCAAEETILRWLLKHMGPATDAAEQLRRYPLTWTTLGCLFERISLFSLSKIFMERRFIPVLLQSAKDIAKPQKQTVNGDDAPSRKRKRDYPAKFDLDYLRAPDALIDSATELFGALSRLLPRLDVVTGYHDEDAVFGAEHVKSLFRMPGEEARNLIAPLLWVCARSLDLIETGLFEKLEKWIRILMALWDFHLGSAGDAHEFANYLYYPSCVVLYKLQGLDETQRDHQTSQIWTKQIERLLMKNLVNPARTTFANGAGLGALEVALETAVQHASVSAQILWRLAVRTRRNSQDPVSKKAHLSWTQSVFKLLLNFLEQNEAVAPAIVPMLDLAVRSSCPPDSEALRHVCKKYALRTESVDWRIVADIVECDSDVFLLDDATLNALFDRVTSFSTKDTKDASDSKLLVERVITPLVEAFSRARDLVGFIKRWHGQLSRVLKTTSKSALTDCPWFDASLRARCGRLTQDSLSVKQLLGLLDWVQEQDLSDGAYLVIFDAICQGVTDEAYVQAINLRLYNIAFATNLNPKLPAELIGLRWRIIGTTVSWVSAEAVSQMWRKIRDPVFGQLLRDDYLNLQTLEAFNCCAKFFLANYPSGVDLADIDELTRKFLRRIATGHQAGNDSSILAQYLETVFVCFPRLQKSTGIDNDALSGVVEALFRLGEKQAEKSGIDTNGSLRLVRVQRDPEIMDTDYLGGSLIEPVVNNLDETAGNGWKSPMVITTLLNFPSEAFSKDRRKKIMSSWKKWQKVIAAHAASNAAHTKLVLRLLIEVMRQPTFYTDMAFDDIASLSEYMSSSTLPYVEELVRLFIKQIVSNSDPTFHQQIQQYVQSLDVEEVTEPRIHLIILKSVVCAAEESSTNKAPSQILEQKQFTKKLRKLLESSFSQFTSKLKKPEKLMDEEEELLLLDLTLRAAESIKVELPAHPLKISSKTLRRLESAGEVLTAQGITTGWKLQSFLASNQKEADPAALLSLISRDYSASPDPQPVFDLVDAVTRQADSTARLELAHQLLQSSSTWKSTDVPYWALERIVDTIQVSAPVSITVAENQTFDLATLHVALALSLREATSLEQFRNIAQVVNLLLEKHATSMTQVNVESTLAAVATVCSFSPGTRSLLQSLNSGASAAGAVFDTLCRLTATTIKRHRLRLEGHHHLLVTALQALLRVLVASPAFGASIGNPNLSSSTPQPPAWLDARLKPRHAAKFARLLTLICEPSAASVAARGNHNKSNGPNAGNLALDSATDAVKRSAGQHMFRVLMAYIKLQLDEAGAVPRDVRKELDVGVYSVLSITPESCLRIMNEGMDASGRAIFRTMYADYKKFGKWSGV